MTGDADVYVPDGLPPGEALARTTHLGIGAHPDDLEFMAIHGILECHGRDDRWFGGITCADGAGSAAGGRYAALSPLELARVRRAEQRRAARLGEYAFVAQLGYPSASIVAGPESPLVRELAALIRAAAPGVIYTHSPLDKHPTHLRVLAAVLDALQTVPCSRRPARLLGGEVWRGLDWLPDSRKVVLDVTAGAPLARRLAAVFRSQIAGAKRYDHAVAARRQANATFLDPRACDAAAEVCYAIDLTPLIGAGAAAASAFAAEQVDALRAEAVAAMEAALR